MVKSPGQCLAGGRAARRFPPAAAQPRPPPAARAQADRAAPPASRGRPPRAPRASALLPGDCCQRCGPHADEVGSGQEAWGPHLSGVCLDDLRLLGKLAGCGFLPPPWFLFSPDSGVQQSQMGAPKRGVRDLNWDGAWWLHPSHPHHNGAYCYSDKHRKSRGVSPTWPEHRCYRGEHRAPTSPAHPVPRALYPSALPTMPRVE